VSALGKLHEALKEAELGNYGTAMRRLHSFTLAWSSHVTETIRTGSNAVQTKRDVFVFRAPGRRVLLETTESERET